MSCIRGRTQAFSRARSTLRLRTSWLLVATTVRATTGLELVGLTGGVFQNALLVETTCQKLDGLGFRTLLHTNVPCNDGGLALGQAAVAGYRLDVLGEGHVMCLGIPGRVTTRHEDRGTPMATVDFGGVTKQVCLAYAPEAVVGDHVIVHAGFAISVLDEAAAAAALEVFGEMGLVE